jgi:hypothetical protein
VPAEQAYSTQWDTPQAFQRGLQDRSVRCRRMQNFPLVLPEMFMICFPARRRMMTITRTSTASVMAGSMRATLSGYWRCCGSSSGNRQTKTGISIADAQTILCDFVELDLHDCAERGKLGGS